MRGGEGIVASNKEYVVYIVIICHNARLHRFKIDNNYIIIFPQR